MLRAVAAKGEALFSPTIARKLATFFANMRPDAPQGLFPELTEREHEVLALIGQGYNNHEIAHRLTLSQKTVRNHVSNILSKLQVADRTALALLARNKGLTIIN